MHASSIRTALARAFQIPSRPIKSAVHNFAISNASKHSNTNFTSRLLRASFSTGAVRAAKKDKVIKPDRRITLIRYFLHHPTTLTPRPLRFSRNRSLRHWTIHRAWNLFMARKKLARQMELERQYNAMAAANEELRVNAGDGGKLFRKAMMKTGVWSIPERGGGVPIEYARGEVEWVGSTGGLGSGGGGATGSAAESGSKAKIWDSQWQRG